MPVGAKGSLGSSSSNAHPSCEKLSEGKGLGPSSAGLTGKLLGMVVSSSVPFKATLQTVQNAVATNKVTGFSMDRKWDWKTPARDFIQQAQDAGAGFDGFRATVLNLDTSEPADVYAAFFFDES